VPSLLLPQAATRAYVALSAAKSRAVRTLAAGFSHAEGAEIGEAPAADDAAVAAAVTVAKSTVVPTATKKKDKKKAKLKKGKGKNTSNFDFSDDEQGDSTL
jgi:hypothetical protein